MRAFLILRLRLHLRLLVVLLAAGVLGATLKGSEPFYSLKSYGDPKIYKEGDWELRIYYRYKGTPKEEMNGDLFFRGKRLAPVFGSEYLITPLGDLTFFISPKLPFKWPNVVIGWTFCDSSKVPWTIAKHPVWEPRDYRHVGAPEYAE